MLESKRKVTDVDKIVSETMNLAIEYHNKGYINFVGGIKPVEMKGEKGFLPFLVFSKYKDKTPDEDKSISLYIKAQDYHIACQLEIGFKAIAENINKQLFISNNHYGESEERKNT